MSTAFRRITPVPNLCVLEFTATMSSWRSRACCYERSTRWPWLALRSARSERSDLNGRTGWRTILVFVVFPLAQVFFYRFDQRFAAGEAWRRVGRRPVGVRATPVGTLVDVEAF